MRLILTLFLVLLAGCAPESVRRVAGERQQAVYSRAIPLYAQPVNDEEGAHDLAPYRLSAASRCADSGCSRRDLYFVVRPIAAESEVPMTLAITVEDERVDWREAFDEPLLPRGVRDSTMRAVQFVATPDQLEWVAFGEQVIVYLGERSFPLAYADRLPMRELDAELRAGTPRVPKR